jgi:beta-glucanase (GH16 family)
MQIDRTNPFQEGINTSLTVLEYHDTGGQYANVRFDVPGNFDFDTGSRFTFKVYVISTGLTGSQPNQISIKLQDGRLQQPWATQSEIIKPLQLDTWQEVTVDFASDPYINFDPGSPPPTERKDFNRVLFQLNGENNNDHVLAWIDDVQYDGELPPEPMDPVYDELVWSDEFNEDGPADADKWHAQTIFPRGNSWFNGEIQHYTDRIDNAMAENGILKITAKRETYIDQGVTKDYTSARLNSKFAFTHGRVEVKAKMPKGVGTFPAIWMLGKNIDELGGYWQTQGFGEVNWPFCGEIDIIEHWGDNQDYVSSATHTPSSFGGTVNVGGRILPGASEEFHTYELLWSPERLKFSIDSVVHYIYEPSVKNDDTWPFDMDMYILLNVAMLPNVDPMFQESAMELDYVRVYQEKISTDVKDGLATKMEVYPNPTTGDVTIDLGEEMMAQARLEVCDLSGRVLVSRIVKVESGRAEVEGLENLKGGVYFFRLTTNQKRFVARVVKE